MNRRHFFQLQSFYLIQGQENIFYGFGIKHLHLCWFSCMQKCCSHRSWQPFIYLWNSKALQIMLRGRLVCVGTTFPKSTPTGPIFPASPKVKGEASQLPKVFSYNASLTFFMAGTVRPQAGPGLHILCGNKIMLWSFKQSPLPKELDTTEREVKLAPLARFTLPVASPASATVRKCKGNLPQDRVWSRHIF